MKTLILYATKHGAAREIAERIASRIDGAISHDLKQGNNRKRLIVCCIIALLLYAILLLPLQHMGTADCSLVFPEDEHG